MNSFRLKGIHLAIKSGMLAAETAFDAVRAGDTSARRLQCVRGRSTPARSARSCIRRNVHQAFGNGLMAGLAFAGLTVLTGGRWPTASRPAVTRGCGSRGVLRRIRVGRSAPSNAVRPDRVLTFDKVTSVHYSGTRHDEDQPAAPAGPDRRLLFALRRGVRPPVQRFCPANVYEMVQEHGRTRCRSTRATASTARRATSWTPTR